MSNQTIYCFQPLIQPDSEILFLGSAPSVQSRRQGFFYGNPTNRFWKILTALYHDDFVGADIPTKTALVQKHRLALWDVYASCEMKKANSSMDSDIINQQFNDVPTLVRGTAITRIAITSKKAYLDFIKHWQNQIPPHVQVINLPSPSSANRNPYKTDAALTAAWQDILFPGMN